LQDSNALHRNKERLELLVGLPRYSNVNFVHHFPDIYVNLDACLQIPISLYEQFMQKVSLFKGCSLGFVKHILRKSLTCSHQVSKISEWKVGLLSLYFGICILIFLDIYHSCQPLILTLPSVIHNWIYLVIILVHISFVQLQCQKFGCICNYR